MELKRGEINNMEKTTEPVENDLQKIRFLLEKMGDKTRLNGRVLSCQNREYIFDDNFELISVENV